MESRLIVGGNSLRPWAIPSEACWLGLALSLATVSIGGFAPWMARALPIAMPEAVEPGVTLGAAAGAMAPLAGEAVRHRDDPWIVHVVPTISYRGDHYEAKESPRARDAEKKRIEDKRRKRDQRSELPSPADDESEGAARIAAARAASRSALLAYAKANLGKRGPEIGLPPSLWCMDFVNHILRKVGLPATGSRMARSPLSHPAFVRISTPAPGDIVVIARGRSNVTGHVALFNGNCGKGGIKLLGGNQAGGRVTDQCVHGRRVIGYARPAALVPDTRLAQMRERGMVR